MTVQLFGGIWSPTCASFALHKTLKGRRNAMMEEAKRNFYDDDLLLSTHSEKEAIDYVQQLQRKLKEGGFRLTKWLSNSRAVMASISPTERNTSIRDVNLLGDLPIDRALGMIWDLHNDTLKVRTTTPSKPCTCRGILSIMSSMYDPLSVLSPFTVRAKMIFQEVRRKVSWDKELAPENVAK
ncbi:uncharacterized protein LOC122250282 [Penaeus japonicus]|uniref:uncharacterized protein LOC122250282 n=1 Tax=Penaeus japonicus TaxID=27405 RepID=UPI001C7132B2|nr:uncharacterized protein LOC122250282 [Penaeus japonicus]